MINNIADVIFSGKKKIFHLKIWGYKFILKEAKKILLGKLRFQF